MLAAAHRFDGGIESKHVGLVRKILHSLGDPADLLRPLGELRDLRRDLVHLSADVGQSAERFLDGGFALRRNLVGFLRQLEDRLRLLRREQRGLFDLLRRHLRLLQRRRLPGDGLALLAGALAQLVAGVGQELHRILQRAEDLLQLLDHLRERRRQLADLIGSRHLHFLREISLDDPPRHQRQLAQRIDEPCDDEDRQQREDEERGGGDADQQLLRLQHHRRRRARIEPDVHDRTGDHRRRHVDHRVPVDRRLLNSLRFLQHRRFLRRRASLESVGDDVPVRPHHLDISEVRLLLHRGDGRADRRIRHLDQRRSERAGDGLAAPDGLVLEHRAEVEIVGETSRDGEPGQRQHHQRRDLDPQREAAQHPRVFHFEVPFLQSERMAGATCSSESCDRAAPRASAACGIPYTTEVDSS